MSDSDESDNGKSRPISEVLVKVKAKSKEKKKSLTSVASSMLNFFCEKRTTRNSDKSMESDGTTVKKVVTTETWFTAHPGYKPGQRRRQNTYASTVNSPLDDLMNWQIM